MYKKLKYEKFKNMNNLLTINLHNGYTIVAIIGKDNTGTYDVQLMLKENTVDRWDLIEEYEHLTIFATEKTICSAILKLVSTYLANGAFDYYINRYQYELSCFDIGSELQGAYQPIYYFNF